MENLVPSKKILEKIWLMFLLCSISLLSLGQASATNEQFYSNSLGLERNLQFYLPERYTDLAIYFDCGAQDETFAYAFNTSFADYLDCLGIPYDFQSLTGGHADQLATMLPVAIHFLDSVMNPIEIEADTGVWTYKTPIPTGRGFTSGAIVDSKIYIIGGFPDHYSVTASVEMYTPATDTWTEMQSMPEARCSHATCAYKGKIYVFGGISPNGYSSAKNNVYVYDPQNNLWSERNEMPYEIAFCGIAAVDDTIYLLGGTRQMFEPPISKVMAYQPETETWTEKSALPTASAFISACELDGKIYAFGGGNEKLVSYGFKSVQVYDTKADRWEIKKDMKISRMAAGICKINEKIFLMGGITDGLTVIDSNDLYDPETDAWKTKSPMEEKRQTFFLGVIDGKIYAIGGSYPDPQNRSVPLIPVSAEVYDYLLDE